MWRKHNADDSEERAAQIAAEMAAQERARYNRRERKRLKAERKALAWYQRHIEPREKAEKARKQAEATAARRAALQDAYRRYCEIVAGQTGNGGNGEAR